MDRDSYKNLCSVEDVDIKAAIRENIQKVDGGNAEEYAVLKSDKSGKCLFLGTDGLCGIQSVSGHTALPSTCRTYPRLVNEVDGVIEMSGNLSCPEVLRLALFNEAGIEFSTDKFCREDVFSQWRVSSLDTAAVGVPSEARPLLSELRRLSLEIVQAGVCSVDERLILLGMLYDRVEACFRSGDYGQVRNELDSKRAMLADPSFVEMVEGIPSGKELQVQLLIPLLEGYLEASGIGNDRYRDCHDDLAGGLYEGDRFDLQSVLARYRNSSDTFFRYFREKHEYILENYIVMMIFSYGLPYRGAGWSEVFSSYVALVVKYSLVRLHLVGMAARHRGLTANLAGRLIQSFCRELDSNQPFMGYLSDALSQSGCTGMGHMATLLKM